MSREVDFRDGKRVVPDHLADMMETLPTHTMTFEQAVEKANWKLASDYLDRAQDRITQGHFTRSRDGG